MKSMRSIVRLGANRSHSRSYGEDLQRRMADEGAISCNRFSGTDYEIQLSGGFGGDRIGQGAQLQQRAVGRAGVQAAAFLVVRSAKPVT